MVDAIEGVCRSIEAGRETTCPGEFGREALEVAIALRESHRRGNVRVDLPLEDRGSEDGVGSALWILFCKRLSCMSGYLDKYVR